MDREIDILWSYSQINFTDTIVNITCKWKVTACALVWTIYPSLICYFYNLSFSYENFAFLKLYWTKLFSINQTSLRLKHIVYILFHRFCSFVKYKEPHILIHAANLFKLNSPSSVRLIKNNLNILSHLGFY